MHHVKKSLLLITILGTIHSNTLALCSSPSIPTIPDGKTSSKEEITNASSEVKQLQKALINYRNCLTQLSTSITATDDASQQAKATLLDRYNQSVDRETKVAKKFNQALRAYKSK